MIDVRDIVKDVDDEVARYFRGLGFAVTWDFRREDGARWYEIIDKPSNKLLLQIDMGVPLADILEDLPLLAEGKPGTSKPDYGVFGSLDNLRVVAAAAGKVGSE